MRSRVLQARLVLLLALVSPMAALAQASTWSVAHADGVAVMDEISKLTFNVTNTGGTRPLSEITLTLNSTSYELDSAEAPTGWTVALLNRASRRVTFRVAGTCPAASSNGLAPGASAAFVLRVVGAVAASDQNNEAIVQGTSNSYGKDYCGNVTFTVPNLGQAKWRRVGLSASIQVLPRASAVGSDVTAQVVVENRSSAQQNNIELTGPTPVGSASFDILSTTPARMSLAAGQGGIFFVTARSTGAGTAVERVLASNNSVTSQTAEALQVNVGPLAATMDVSAVQAIPNETITLRLQVANTSADRTYRAVTPRAPQYVGSVTLQSLTGPTPASVDVLGPGATASFSWTYKVSGTEGAQYQFRTRADATLAGAPVSTELVESATGRIVLLRVRANPDGLIPGANRLVRYTVENRGTESIRQIKLLKPAPSHFGAATMPAASNPANWTMSQDSAGYIWDAPTGAGQVPLLPGASLTVALQYSSIASVVNDTPFLHRVVVVRNGAQRARMQSDVTVLGPKVMPEVRDFAVLAGDGRNTLIWTNPSDHSGVVVLRAMGSAPDTAPTPGAYYSPGNVLGNATVVFSDELSTASRFVDTTVTNGTEYRYRVFNFDEQHRYAAGNVPTSQGLKARPVARGPGAPLWCYSVGTSSLNQPITELGVGIFSSFNNAVIANLTRTSNPALDGDERWRPVALQGTIGGRFPVVPLRGLSGQYLLVGTQAGYMYALNAATGAVLWTGDGGQPLGRIQSFPVTQLHDYANAAYQAAQPRDLVFFATRLDGDARGNKVVALNGATGQRVWLYAPGDLDMVSGGMLVDYTNNRLYIPARSNGNSQPSLRILNTLNGQEVARLSLGDIDFSVVRLTATNQALVTANNGTVYGVGLNSMSVEWSKALSAAPTNYVRPQGRGYVATLQSGHVQYHYLEPQPDGSNLVVERWSTPIAGPSGSFAHTLNASTARVYVGSSDGKVHELDSQTGADLKQVSLGAAQRIGIPTVDNTVSRLHVGTQDGRVCAFQVPFQ
ncbi:PQQ-binding-like beta-propeller repeat protein [Myxococcaceae bacterium GXIMD 01537]